MADDPNDSMDSTSENTTPQSDTAKASNHRDVSNTYIRSVIAIYPLLVAQCHAYSGYVYQCQCLYQLHIPVIHIIISYTLINKEFAVLMTPWQPELNLLAFHLIRIDSYVYGAEEGAYRTDSMPNYTRYASVMCLVHVYRMYSS